MITFLTWTAIIAVVLLAIVGFGVVTIGTADYLNHSKEVKSLLPPHLIPYDHPPEVLAELYDDEALRTLHKGIMSVVTGRGGVECPKCKLSHRCECDKPEYELAVRIEQAQKLRDFNEATADIGFAFDKEIRA